MANIASLIDKLQVAIDSGDPAKIVSAMKSASSAAQSVEFTGNPHLQELEALIAQAQGLVKSDGPSGGEGSKYNVMQALSDATAVESSAVKQLSTDEKRYYDSFKPGETYKVQEIDPKTGKLKTDAAGNAVTKEVDGKEIRHAIATTKYYATPEEKRTTEMKEARPEAYNEEHMKDLKENLNTLQGRRAIELHGDAKELHAMSEHFDTARSKVDKVIEAKRAVDADAKGKKSDNPIEQAARGAGSSIKLQSLIMAEHELTTSMQDDVLNGAMGLNKSESKTKQLTMQTDKFVSESVPGSDNHFTPLSNTDVQQKPRTTNPAFALQ